MRESGCGWFRSSARPNKAISPTTTLHRKLYSRLPKRPSCSLSHCSPRTPGGARNRLSTSRAGRIVFTISLRARPRGCHTRSDRRHRQMTRHPDHLKLLHDRPGFEEEFVDPLEEEDGAVGGFRHEFYLCFPGCAFMAAGSVAEREGSKRGKGI